ncbi:MAG: putative ABC transporter permease [Dysosmobacter sp.]
MYVYTPGQWALLFFFYCFCGWVWESCYVSAKQRHWVNRGFLRGPLLPIYGSGAIIILFATLPVADNFWLVYFLGMLAATALEYVVGAVMEQLFKVRYWDYTKQPFNLHGYICLTSSIAWGFFSDLLIYVIHPPIDKLLHKLPALLVNPLAAVIAVLFIMDTVKSTKAAIDLREVLTKLTEENAELRRLAKKAEAAQARTAEELQAFREKTSWTDTCCSPIWLTSWKPTAPPSRSGSSAAGRLWKTPSRRRVESKLEILANIAQALERPAPRWTMASTNPASRSLPSIGRSWTPSSLPSAREAQVRTRSIQRYETALRVLRANPSAKAKAELGEAFDSLRKLLEK